MPWGGGILAYSKSFADFNTHKEFNIIQGKIPNKNHGDVTLAVKLDGEKYKEEGFPSKEGHKFKGYECTNGVELTWKPETWSALIDAKNPTICILEFESFTSRNLIEVLKESNELVTFTHEDTVQTGSNTNTDYRYTGKDPNNYIKFNDELWRIIGVFNTDDGKGNYEERVKIIRNESIGSMSLDENNTNNWSNTSLQKYLNGEYYNNFTIDAKNMIKDAKWYLGGHDYVDYGSYLDYYKEERSNKIYSANSKNWIGSIALMYPSDYGYACEDKSCLSTSLSNTDFHQLCVQNNWIYKGNIMYTAENSEFPTYAASWTIIPSSTRGHAQSLIRNDGIAYFESAVKSYLIRPSLYLKHNIETTGGDGTKEKPYELLSE